MKIPNAQLQDIEKSRWNQAGSFFPDSQPPQGWKMPSVQALGKNCHQHSYLAMDSACCATDFPACWCKSNKTVVGVTIYLFHDGIWEPFYRRKCMSTIINLAKSQQLETPQAPVAQLLIFVVVVGLFCQVGIMCPSNRLLNVFCLCSSILATVGFVLRCFFLLQATATAETHYCHSANNERLLSLLIPKQGIYIKVPRTILKQGLKRLRAGGWGGMLQNTVSSQAVITWPSHP